MMRSMFSTALVAALAATAIYSDVQPASAEADLVLPFCVMRASEKLPKIPNLVVDRIDNTKKKFGYDLVFRTRVANVPMNLSYSCSQANSWDIEFKGMVE